MGVEDQELVQAHPNAWKLILRKVLSAAVLAARTR